MRLMFELRAGAMDLRTRNGTDATRRFPELHALVEQLTSTGTHDALLDGELISPDETGRPSFAALAHRIHREPAAAATPVPATAGASGPRPRTDRDLPPVHYVVFDLLRLDGQELIDRSYSDRRDRLAGLSIAGPVATVTESFDDGPALWRATVRAGLEGVVAKRRSSRYRPGLRSPDWIKRAQRRSVDLAVVAWRPVRGRTAQVGALALVARTPRGWDYVGTVGSGISAALSDALLPVLRSIERPNAPLPGLPRLSEHTWVEPFLVVQVDYRERGADGGLRQPSVARMRPDLTASDLVPQDP